MFKLAIVVLALLLVGSNAKSMRNDFTEEDAKKVLHLVFCACDDIEWDGQLNLEEFMSPECEVINDHIFGYQVNEEHFEAVDADNSGTISVDEVWDALIQLGDAAGRMDSVRDLYFSDNVHVEAAVRVIGCACDTDESFTISMDEVNGEDCTTVQEWIFGQTLDQEGFEFVDANNDGEIDGSEAASALEAAMDQHHS